MFRRCNEILALWGYVRILFIWRCYKDPYVVKIFWGAFKNSFKKKMATKNSIKYQNILFWYMMLTDRCLNLVKWISYRLTGHKMTTIWSDYEAPVSMNAENSNLCDKYHILGYLIVVSEIVRDRHLKDWYWALRHHRLLVARALVHCSHLAIYHCISSFHFETRPGYKCIFRYPSIITAGDKFTFEKSG